REARGVEVRVLSWAPFHPTTRFKASPLGLPTLGCSSYSSTLKTAIELPQLGNSITSCHPQEFSLRSTNCHGRLRDEQMDHPGGWCDADGAWLLHSSLQF